MTLSGPHLILLAVGDDNLASQVVKALDHPLLRLVSVKGRGEIGSALRNKAWSLVVFGGPLDDLSPLQGFEEIRQHSDNVPLLVLLDQGTSSFDFEELEAQHLAGVSFCDANGSSVAAEIESRIRSEAFTLIGLDDNADENDDDLPAAPAESREEMEDCEERSRSPVDAIDSNSALDVPPPIPGDQVTADDIAFARRTIQQTANVNFRVSLAKPTSTGAADRSAELLRFTVRDLEIRLARMAHVYRGRLRDFERLDHLLHDARVRHETLEQHIASLDRQLAAQEESQREEQRDHYRQLSQMSKALEQQKSIQNLAEIFAKDRTQIYELVSGLKSSVSDLKDKIEAPWTMRDLRHQSPGPLAQNNSITITSEGTLLGGERSSQSTAEANGGDSQKTSSGFPVALVVAFTLPVVLAALVFAVTRTGSPVSAKAGRSAKEGSQTVVRLESPATPESISEDKGSSTSESTSESTPENEVSEEETVTNAPGSVASVKTPEVEDSSPSGEGAPESSTLQDAEHEMMQQAADKNNWQEVMEIGDRLRAGGPLRLRYARLHAESLRLLGHTKLAELAYREILERFPDNPRADEVQLRIGLLLMRQRRFYEAKSILDVLAADQTDDVGERAARALQQLATIESVDVP